MCGSIRFLTPEPYSHGSITGWRTITQNTRIPAWATAHRGSTLHHSNQPSVRSNGVNSTELNLRLGLFYRLGTFEARTDGRSRTRVLPMNDEELLKLAENGD